MNRRRLLDFGYNYGYEYNYDYPVHMNSTGSLFTALMYIYLIILTVIVIFALASYIFHSVGMYTIGKRMGREYAWLAFIPFARDYFHGELAGAIPLKSRKIKNPGIWNLVLPIIYTNVLDGIGAVDKNLLEMAEVFQVPAGRRLRYIYISQVLPFFRSGCSIALGLCWKSGIAAEVIGIPDHSIGEHLYNAKVYLDTPDLFAWTLVIVLISIAFEKLFLTVLDAAVRYTERMV